LVLWHPKGTVIRKIIRDFWEKEHQKDGYQLVSTPHIAKGELWETSGHLEYYHENMYVFDKEGESTVVKPMNCPFHIQIYKSRPRSYRELPIRYAEW
jgi:threonyl-tRNA synthetase